MADGTIKQTHVQFIK